MSPCGPGCGPKEGDAVEPESGDRLGLALSGGGFRASFFHVGVLAQMAALGLLRHVEALSTVSGGSIIGALYYLHLKQLLESKTDDEITDRDFVALVERIEVEFLRAVQRNIRMRTFLNPMKNIRMSLPTYSRSDRIGELYDRYFYRPVLDPQRRTPIEMRELKIRPKGAPADFHPERHNLDRKAKVPILLINATALNTGHNWRFEASRMGEPPRGSRVARDIDKNLRLRRPPSYDAIIAKQQNIELGLAVAASACVPGLFHPLAISDLYPNGIRVELVDGGVHDNQGVQALVDAGCSAFIVSDASGQMDDEPTPSTEIPAVLGRMSSILMDRVREEELFGLLNRPDPPVAFMHLRKGLSAEAVSWIGPDGRPAEPRKTERRPEIASEHFGVAQQVQDLLSRVRTDLDSFTDVEAYSLMLDGYRMSEDECRKAPGIKELIADTPALPDPRWRFQEIAAWIARPTPAYLQQLAVGSHRVLKVFRLSRAATAATVVVVVALGWFVGAALKDEVNALLSASVTVGTLLLTGLVLAIGFIPKLSRIVTVLRFLRMPAELLVRLVTKALLPALASPFVLIHLQIFDRLFLSRGKVERLGPPPA